MKPFEMAEKRGEDAPSDDALGGLEWNLNELYERHHRQVFHLALRYGRGNASFAEDVMHDVFIKLCRARERLSEPEALSGWLYRVTTNVCLNKLRHEALVNSAPVRWLLGERTDERTPESALLARDELTRAFEAVNALPLKERAIFFMCHVDGKEQTEVARVLGHSKGYVSKLLKRAEARLAALGWEVSS